MAGSSSEREIRDYAADRLRCMLPDARIIHELVVGGCRADLAAVERERITLVEIKSEKDTLKRLPEQVRQFGRSAHQVIIIAHERWFDDTPYNNGNPRFVPGANLGDASSYHPVWAYPEDCSRRRYGQWGVATARGYRAEPHAQRLLELCWRDELAAECFRHGIKTTSRTNMTDMICAMAWGMTGKEIAQAVCRQLRRRVFVEADAPIVENA